MGTFTAARNAVPQHRAQYNTYMQPHHGSTAALALAAHVQQRSRTAAEHAEQLQGPHVQQHIDSQQRQRNITPEHAQYSSTAQWLSFQRSKAAEQNMYSRAAAAAAQ